MKNKEQIIEFLENNNGYIITSDFLNMNINKSSTQNYIDSGLIERVSYELYMDSKLFKDEYFI